MNKVSVLNLIQGLLNAALAYVYFSTGDRITTLVILFVLFLISLLLVSSGIKRRSKIAEIFEILIYFFFFAFTFMRVENFKSLSSSGPVPNYFWMPWTIGLIMNWGEYLGTIILKITRRAEEA